MKNPLLKILFLFSLLLPKSVYADSSVYAQNETESPTHELPIADRCSVITLHIRDLVFLLQGVVKEISLLEPTVPNAAEKDGYYERQKNEYELKLLQQKASSLRIQIDMKEQQLENCVHYNSNLPEQKDSHKETKEKRN